MIRDYMQDGIARFDQLQILNFNTSPKMEVFVHKGNHIPAHLGKGAGAITKNFQKPAFVPIYRDAPGEYFYWYTFPLMNYYHCINDGLGPVYNYLQLKESKPDLKFMLNVNPRGIDVHPPFVTEVLDLLDIEYEFTNENYLYETVYFSDTLVQNENGKRCRPADGVYEMIRKLVETSRRKYPNVITHDNIYLSRRAHANPLNNRKAVIGEDNTVKRGITNEDEIVEILRDLGYAEVFGENYSLGEKISMFSRMNKYISTAGAGVTNILWRIGQPLNVGGIHTPGFGFPVQSHSRHICTHPIHIRSIIDCYPGKVCFVDEEQGRSNYNSPWYINNLEAFKQWASTI